MNESFTAVCLLFQNGELCVSRFQIENETISTSGTLCVT